MSINLEEHKVATFKRLGADYNKTPEELEKALSEVKTDLLVYDENKVILSKDPVGFEIRALNVLDTRLSNTIPTETFNAIITGVDDPTDFNSFLIKKIQKQWDTSDDSAREKMKKEGLVIVKIGASGDLIPIVEDGISKSGKDAAGHFVVLEGEEWKPNCGKPVAIRDNREHQFDEETVNKNFTLPLEPEPRVVITGIIDISKEEGKENHKRFKRTLYGVEYAAPRSPKFAGRLPMNVPIQMKGSISEDASTEDCMVITGKFEIIQFSPEEILAWKQNKGINLFVDESARDHKSTRKLTLAELAKFFDAEQAKRNSDGSFQVKSAKDPKYNSIKIDDTVFAYGDFVVRKVTPPSEGKPAYVTVNDASAKGSGQEAFGGSLRKHDDHNLLKVGMPALFCFRVHRGNTKWSRAGTEPAPLGSGDCRMDFLGFYAGQEPAGTSGKPVSEKDVT